MAATLISDMPHAPDSPLAVHTRGTPIFREGDMRDSGSDLADRSLLWALEREISSTRRPGAKPTAPDLCRDMTDSEVDAMVARAVAAQQSFAGWAEARVDAMLQEIAETIAEHADHLARATVAETGIGNVHDKTIKNRFASLDVYRSLAGKPGVGLLRVDTEHQIAEIASPVGVILGLVPVTNPVATMVFKALIALKARNALILSCHRNALAVSAEAGELIRAVLLRHGAPIDLIQWVRHRTNRATALKLMRHKGIGLILATGGSNLVRAAYSSGKPAIGVGPGNAPAWICADADVDTAARQIVASKSFDNGVICGSENHLVVDAAAHAGFVTALTSAGAAVLTADEVSRCIDLAFDPASGELRSELIGQSAQHIAHVLGIRREYPIRLIVVPMNPGMAMGRYGREKLAPVASLFTVEGVAQGLAVCRQLLANQGSGHTAIIHTQSQGLIVRFGVEIPASRVLVNAPGAQGCIGMGNGLTPSLTLGCGTFGGTSTTDNVSYTHLLNIKRIAYHSMPVA